MAVSFKPVTLLCPLLLVLLIETSIALPKPHLTHQTDNDRNKTTPASLDINNKQPEDLFNIVNNISHKKINSNKLKEIDLEYTIDNAEEDRNINVKKDFLSRDSFIESQEEYVNSLNHAVTTLQGGKDSMSDDSSSEDTINDLMSLSNNEKQRKYNVMSRSYINPISRKVLPSDRIISSRIKRFMYLVDPTKKKAVYDVSVETSTVLPSMPDHMTNNNILSSSVDSSDKKTTKQYDNANSLKDNSASDVVLPNSGKSDKVIFKAKDSLKKTESYNDDGGKMFPTNVRLCIYKFKHVAHAARVSAGDIDDESNYGDDGIEYTEYDEKEPVISNMTLDNIGDVQVEHCAKATDSCYAYWTEDPDSHQITMIGQGCWESSDRQESCWSDACTSERPPSRARPSAKFCCCQDDLCNAKPISAPPNTAIIPVEKDDVPLPAVGKTWIAVVFASLTVAVLVIAVIWKFRNKPTDKDAAIDNPELGNVGGPGFSCSATCVDNLKLHDNIGSGRYAKVWRGSLGGVPVAVKALPAARAPLWARERDLYCLPHMTHSNLLLYLGCDTRPTLDGGPEHLLVLQLAPLGSLRQYLIDHTLEWDVYTKMALGVASALAHLHTHIDKNNEYKPCIVHRDVNSSNVVVRADLSCCLADLGLAMSLPDAKKRLPAAHQHRIHEAGTLRYLSPEALEGALDLRSCAAALRAVDVYALALVLWELLSRCAPLHRPPGPHPYEPPFRAEVGEQPTLEQMQVVVARHKARPLFSPRLVNTRGAKLAKDTCEDCWDHDAEARLTAVCVVERLSELKSLRPAPSPTINSNDLRPPASTRDGNTTLHNHHSPGAAIEDKNSNVTSQISSNIIDHLADHNRTRPLQPHQGRNPCMERNLATAGPGDRLLIDKSLKDCLTNVNSVSTSQSTSNSNGYGATIPETRTINTMQAAHDFSRLGSHASSAQNSALLNRNQVSNDLRTAAVRPVTPLGYVQNDVGDTHRTSNCNDYGYGYPAKQENNLKRRENDRRNESGWSLKRLLDVKMFKRKNRAENGASPLDTEVNLVLANGKPTNCGPGKFRTSVIVEDPRSHTKIINRDAVIDRDIDRPSSLPGLDSVISIHDGQSTSNIMNGLNSIDNNLKNINNYAMDINTCTVSPPNRTITSVLEGPRNNTDKGFVMGFKELPNFNSSGLDVNASGSKSPGQIFAVIVPKPMYNGNRDSNSTSGNVTRKENNRLLTAGGDGLRIDRKSNAVKRLSCDESVFSNTDNRLFDIETSSSALIKNDRNVQNRNSYSGEFEVGNFCTYNQDDEPCDNGSMVDYSSNSEDEHMLLLSENGGSKITMRQRFDVKPSDGKSKRRTRQNNQDGGSAPKIPTGSFTSLCNKYGPKNRYESFENECSERLLGTSGVNSYGVNDSSNFENKMVDISPINADAFKEPLKRRTSFANKSDVVHSGIFNGSNLSLCRTSIDDTSFINLETEFDQSIRPDDGDQDSVFYTKNDARNTEIGSDSTDEDDITIKDDDISTVDVSSSASDTKNCAIKPLSIKQNLSRQHSLELVSEIFSSSSADLTRLKDPAGRIKTPGDVPPSVRRMRGTASASNAKVRRTGSQKEPTKTAKNRLSLYDDRMMFGNSL